MIMENLGRYNILKVIISDLLSLTVIKIGISGSSWRFRTKKKTGLMFASSFLLAWLFLCCICLFLFYLLALDQIGDWRLPLQEVCMNLWAKEILSCIHFSKWYELSTFSVLGTKLRAVDTKMKRWSLRHSHSNK